MSSLKMRQSLIGNAETCLKRAAYSLADPVYKTGEARAIGTAYHKALETYYSLRQEHGFHVPDQTERLALEQVAHEEFYREVDKAEGFFWETDSVQCQNKISNMLAAYFNGKHYWPDGYRVIGTEVSFTHEWVGGHLAHGTIDLVLEDPNGWTVLVDHKTAGKKWPKGKEDPRKNIQAPWYVYWWSTLNETEKVYFAFDVMTYGGTFERRPVYPTPKDQELVLAKAKFYAGILSTLGPDDLAGNTSSALCSERYCDAWAACPHGAGPVEGIGDAPHPASMSRMDAGLDSSIVMD
jgi:hypothetical protein